MFPFINKIVLIVRQKYSLYFFTKITTRRYITTHRCITIHRYIVLAFGSYFPCMRRHLYIMIFLFP